MIWTIALGVLRAVLFTVFVFVLLVLIFEATDSLPDWLLSLLRASTVRMTLPQLIRWAAAAFIYGLLLIGSLGVSGVLVFYALNPALSTTRRFAIGGLLPIPLGVFFWLRLWTKRRRTKSSRGF